MRSVPGTQTGSQPRPAVVYDGECPFCRGQVDRMRQRDVDSAFDYLPRQTEGLTERFPKLAEGDFNTGMRLVQPDGSVSVGADAVYEIARQLKGWKYFAWLYRVPVLHALARWTYAWIARNRMKLVRNCDQACQVSASEKD